MLLSNSFTCLIQIQHPRFLLNRFDLVITPRHDYYPLTPHAQQQIPWFLRRWVTPWEPPGRNVVGTTAVCVAIGLTHLWLSYIKPRCSICPLLKVADFT